MLCETEDWLNPLGRQWLHRAEDILELFLVKHARCRQIAHYEHCVWQCLCCCMDMCMHVHMVILLSTVYQQHDRSVSATFVDTLQLILVITLKTSMQELPVLITAGTLIVLMRSGQSLDKAMITSFCIPPSLLFILP